MALWVYDLKGLAQQVETQVYHASQNVLIHCSYFRITEGIEDAEYETTMKQR